MLAEAPTRYAKPYINLCNLCKGHATTTGWQCDYGAVQQSSPTNWKDWPKYLGTKAYGSPFLYNNYGEPYNGLDFADVNYRVLYL